MAAASPGGWAANNPAIDPGISIYRAGVARKTKGDEPELIVNAREPSLGVGVLVRRNAEVSTYRFTSGERTFKEAYCKLYIKPALLVPEEVRAKLVPPLPADVAVSAQATNPEIEAQIAAADPDDDAPYLVYADWLQARLDPRGELVTVQHQLAASPRSRPLLAAEKALLERHRDYFLPASLDRALRLPKRARAKRCEVTWRAGFMQRVRLARDASASSKNVDLAAIAKSLLAHPSAKFLHSLVLGQLGTDPYTYSPLLAAVAKQRHPLLAELVVGDFTPDDIELASTRAGTLTPTLKAMPGLRRLMVKAGSLRFDSKTAHANLRELKITTTRLSAEDGDGLHRASLPALELLELTGEELGYDEDQLAIWRAGELLPSLRRLVLRGLRAPAVFVDNLVESPLLARLESLELGGNGFGDGAAGRVLANRDRFAHLAKLTIAADKLSPGLAAQIEEVIRTATADRTPLAIAESAVVRMAPDKASLAAARLIAHPEKWLALGHDRRRDRLWGEYDGRNHYYVFAELHSRQSGCDCASPKSPCKHALALRMLAARQHPFPDQPVPDALVRNSSRERPVYGRWGWDRE